MVWVQAGGGNRAVALRPSGHYGLAHWLCVTSCRLLDVLVASLSSRDKLLWNG